MNNKKMELEDMNISEKEEEIKKTYEDDNIELLDEEENNDKEEIQEDVKEEVTEEVKEDTKKEEKLNKKEEKRKKKEEKKNKKNKKKKERNIAKIIINTVFTIIILIMILVIIDVVCLTQFNMGPFFTIPLKVYKDGGTTEYYGLGYKVIQYKQTQGRRDKEIGTWALKYNVEPLTFQDIDLAIELTGNEENTYQKYDKKFVRIISTLRDVDTKKKQIKIGYKDEDGKYTLDIVCNVVKEQKNLKKLKKDKEITIIGTMDSLKLKTKKNNNTIYITNCFAEQ